MLVCLGDSMVDQLVFVKHFPEEGGEATARGEVHAGGSAANTAMVLAKLQTHVGLISSLGNDLEGDFLKEVFQRVGVDTRLLETTHMNTGKMVIVVSPGGQRTMFSLRPPRSVPFEQLESVWQSIKGKAHLHVSGYVFLREKEAAFARELVKRCSTEGGRVSLDPGVSPVKMVPGRLREVLPFVDYFFPNETELHQLVPGESNAQRAARLLLQKETGTIVLKRGERGCSVFSRDGAQDFPPSRSVVAENTTGCGDAFNAGFLAGLEKGFSVENAAELANQCGEKVASSKVSIDLQDFSALIAG